MKLRCEITGVEQRGDILYVKLQGRPTKCAAWIPWGQQTVEVPFSARSCRTFYVGRIIYLELKP